VAPSDCNLKATLVCGSGRAPFFPNRRNGAGRSGGDPLASGERAGSRHSPGAVLCSETSILLNASDTEPRSNLAGNRRGTIRLPDPSHFGNGADSWQSEGAQEPAPAG
jgi:hypothetical protein